jgi:hypothetical protein
MAVQKVNYMVGWTFLSGLFIEKRQVEMLDFSNIISSPPRFMRPALFVRFDIYIETRPRHSRAGISEDYLLAIFLARGVVIFFDFTLTLS